MSETNSDEKQKVLITNIAVGAILVFFSMVAVVGGFSIMQNPTDPIVYTILLLPMAIVVNTIVIWRNMLPGKQILAMVSGSAAMVMGIGMLQFVKIDVNSVTIMASVIFLVPSAYLFSVAFGKPFWPFKVKKAA
ncbi:MAG: hypothetical protein PHH26_00405 [Candidatus Thermoplasmatota archaeon]|nr:hypothetical protein [Candidatus Thermoplasmatota archaeon]